MPLVGLALASCGSAREVAACEEFIKGELRSPSTYRRISVKSYDGPISERAKAQLSEAEARRAVDNPEWAKFRKERDANAPAGEKAAETMRDVYVEFDSDNAYGTPVRGLQRCGFVLSNGSLLGETALRAKVSLAGANRDYRNLTEDRTEPEYPCCL